MVYLHPRYVCIGSLAANFFTTLFSIICVSVAEWIRHEDDKYVQYIGLYVKESSPTASHTVATTCSSDLSESACTYLRSAKASAVIAILFGAIITFMAYTQFARWKSLDGSNFFMGGFMTIFQFIFLLMLVVVYSYFKVELHEDDDINVEYPTGTDTTYAWAYKMMVFCTIISFLTASTNFYTAYQMSNRIKRSGSDEKMLK